MLREWKLNFVMINGDEHGSVELGIGDDFISIPVQPINKKLYNRAKSKRDAQKRIDDEREW